MGVGLAQGRSSLLSDIACECHLAYVLMPLITLRAMLIAATIVSTDMADMFSYGHLMLFPTFKEFADAMDFSERVGVRDRTADDHSPRRPLTAVC